MTAKVVDGCILCGICANACPEVFSLGDESAIAMEGEVPSAVEQEAIAARDGCPVSVIELGGA